MTIEHEKEEEIKSQERKYDRFDIALNVYDKDDNLLGVTANISHDGIFMKTEKEINWDEIYMTVSIELPESKEKLKTEGIAVMGKEGGYGITLFLSDENKKKYTDLIESLKKAEK